jgi:hypothetical protein
MVKYACPHPGCGKEKCFAHCNTCGEDIIWRPPGLDAEIAYKGPPMNPDGTTHRCMMEGVEEYRNLSRAYPRRKACVILCPYPICSEPILDEPPERELLDMFRAHLAQKHGHELKEDIGVTIYDRKNYIQNNTRISYLDPFLYVSMEEISK